MYLSLIMDAFSRKIVGWALQPTLEAKGPVGALKMALQTCKKKTEFIYHRNDDGPTVAFSIVHGLTFKRRVSK